MVRVFARLEKCALVDASLVVVVGAMAKFLKLNEAPERLDQVGVARRHVGERAVRFETAREWDSRGRAKLLRAVDELARKPLQVAVLPRATDGAPDWFWGRGDEMIRCALRQIVEHGVVGRAGPSAKIGIRWPSATFAGKPSGVLKQPGGINHAPE